MAKQETLFNRVVRTIESRHLATSETPVLLMVSGGSDSVAMAYLAADLVAAGKLGALSMLHVNHMLRGADAEADAAFVAALANHLGIPLFACTVDVPTLVACEGGNVEAVARTARYQAARDAIESTCVHTGFPMDSGVVFAAHTADDRIENFYMRSIVGTGPGGFRSMDYSGMVEGCRVRRPLLDVGRDELRAYVEARDNTLRDPQTGALWREDATNADTDYFRAFVRHEIVPRAKERNPRLIETLTRTMNLIADEDDILAEQAQKLAVQLTRPLGKNASEGFLLAPELAHEPLPMQRRVLDALLSLMLGPDERVEAASIEACLQALGRPGAVTNIQGNLAVSYNSRGLRIEPMEAFRARRKK